jgi:hypothetical protein
MRTVDFGIEQLLDKPQSGGLNTIEMNVLAVDFENASLVSRLFKLMAIEPATTAEWPPKGSQMKYYKQLSTMKNFHGLVKLMVEHIPCPGIIQLKHISMNWTNFIGL